MAEKKTAILLMAHGSRIAEANDAAREIGRLERKVEVPKAKTQTQAPKPLTTPQGGAAPAKDLMQLAKAEDITAYVQERRRQDAARR